MPVQDCRLVVEPRYPNAKFFEDFYGEERDPDESRVRNVFYSHRQRCDIYVWNDKDGTLQWGRVPKVHGFDFLLSTMGASYAWGIEQEHRALNTLGELIPHHLFKMYLLTGMFLETSKRSGLTYVFRKLRPTVVIDIRPDQMIYNFGELAAQPYGANRSRIVCALCLHPIAFYSGSWAGAMCPTDDVIAHLMLMRGDEPMLWRRANQHDPGRPEAGL